MVSMVVLLVLVLRGKGMFEGAVTQHFMINCNPCATWQLHSINNGYFCGQFMWVRFTLTGFEVFTFECPF